MARTKTGFDKWVATKLKSPGFAKAHQDARKHIEAVDGIVRALDQIREDSGISKAELARSIDAKPEIVRRLFTKAGANPTLETVVEIAAALGLELQLVPVSSKKQAAKPRPRSAKSAEAHAVA
jgi:DNA-binding phage protein